jgi:anti-anti-sigma regulatory factor
MAVPNKELVFSNDLTIHTIESHKKQVKEIMNGKHGIHFNFSQVQSMDLTGVQLFLSMIKTLKNKNRSFSIHQSIPTPVQDALHLSGLLIHPETTVQGLEATIHQFVKDGVL